MSGEKVVHPGSEDRPVSALLGAEWRPDQLSDLVGVRNLESVPRTDIRHPFDTDASGVMFELGGRTFFIFEDPDDGYRSAAAPLLSYAGRAYSMGSANAEYLHGQAVLGVHVTSGEYGGESDLISFRSLKTGLEVLSVGTENVDDYYPSFTVRWRPQNLDVNQADGALRRQDGPSSGSGMNNNSHPGEGQ